MKILNYFIVGGVLLLSSCGMQSMIDNASSVKYKVVPNPLEAKGDKVSSKFLINFPAKYFLKKAQITITPYLTNGNEEIEMEKIQLRGESTTGTGEVINNALGGNVERPINFDYDKIYSNSTLKAKISGTDGKKVYPFPDITIGKGIIRSIELLQEDEIPFLAYPLFPDVENIDNPRQKLSFIPEGGKVFQDQFTLVLDESEQVALFFPKNSSKLRKSQKESLALRDFKKLLKRMEKEDKVITGVEIVGSASPEGPVDINTDLAQGRSGVSTVFYKDVLKKSGVRGEIDLEGEYSSSQINENWKEFQALVDTSELEEKELILNILRSYSDVNEREAELKKLSKVFKDLESDVLPLLRKAELKVLYKPKPKTDDEIKNLSSSNPGALNSEQMLYSVFLTDDDNEKISLLQTYTTMYPEDWRGFNNLGYYLLNSGDSVGAIEALNSANSLSQSNSIVSNNLGIVHRWTGDLEQARKYYDLSSSYGEKNPGLDYNKSILKMIDGDYEGAKTSQTSFKKLNKVLNFILMRDFELALTEFRDLDESLKQRSGGIYLNAIIKSGSGNEDGAKELLSSLESLDSKLFERSKTDLEFSFNR